MNYCFADPRDPSFLAGYFQNRLLVSIPWSWNKEHYEDTDQDKDDPEDVEAIRLKIIDLPGP